MKKCALLYILFLQFFFSVISFAQKPPIKLGEIDEKDVKATKYDKFPDAEAIILCDYGNLTYNAQSNFTKQFERITRIKILTKAGYDKANQTMPYFRTASDIKDIKGYTYNIENGKVVKTKLEKSAIIDKKINKKWCEIKFSMPNVKEGSVIEFSYVVTAPFGSPPTWYFQNDVPTLWSEFKMAVPEYLRFQPLTQVFKDFTVAQMDHTNESFNYRPANTPPNYPSQVINYELYKNHWVLQDIPAFKGEEFISSFKDCVMKVDFKLAAIKMPGQATKIITPSWEVFVEQFSETDKYKKYLSDDLPTPNLLATITKDAKTVKEKVVAVCDYVKNNIRFNDRIGIFPNKTVKEIFEKKAGNCAEINLLLVNMCRKLGLKAFPVVLSTRQNGKMFPDVFDDRKLNYTVAYIMLDATEDMLLDATDAMLPTGMIDYDALNGLGLILMPPANSTDLASWANLQNPKYSKTSQIVTANLTMSDTGIIKGELVQRLGGYDAVKVRRNLLKEKQTNENASEEDEGDDFLDAEADKILKDSTINNKINKFNFKNLKDFDKPLDGTKNIETADFSQVNDDFIYVSPLLEYRMKANPLKSETRNFPVDYPALIEQNFYLNFTIPDGYKIEELPKPMRIKTEDGGIKFEYNISANDNKVQLISKFSLGRVFFKVEEYKMLRDFYAQIVAKQEEQIVLKKK
jgi:hypothetical protein